MVKTSVVSHVTTVKSVEVPPMEDIIIDAYVDRHENQEKEKENRLLVEMHPNLWEGYGCVFAPLMMDLAIGTIVPVHVFNLHS